MIGSVTSVAYLFSCLFNASWSPVVFCSQMSTVRHGQVPFIAFNVASKIQSADSCSRVARSFKEDNKPWPRKRDQSSA